MTRPLKVVVLVVVVTVMSTASAVGKVARVCDVSYLTEEGWSAPFRREVTFVSGRELNTATNSWRFKLGANYFEIWFSEHEVAIVEIVASNPTSGGPDFSDADFDRLFQFSSSIEGAQINSEPVGRQWRIGKVRSGGR